MYSNCWCVLYNGRSNFSPRIDLYDDKAQVGHISCKKTIYIEEAKWKKTESLEPAFSFEVKHNKQYIFVTASKSELSLWILILCCLSKDLFDTKHIIGIQDFGKMDSSHLTEDEEEIVVQENILYSSNNDLSSFTVVAAQTEGCLQQGFKGMYKLNIGQAALHLLRLDLEEVACWSLLVLKNFGHTSRTFFIQCGTRSVTGAGKFIFHTTEGEKITQRLNMETQLIYKQSHKSENLQLKAVTMTTEPPTHENSVKSKPPAPPNKPKSVRNSSHENNQLQHQNLRVNECQGSKKGTPAFGIPVFVPITGQTSNLRISDSVLPPMANDSNQRENSNGLDRTVENDKKQAVLARSESCPSSETGARKDSKKTQKDLKREQKKIAEEEKKERKRREEEKKKEQKKREEEEKKMKKEQKKSKQKLGKTRSNSSQSVSVSNSDINNEYTEADLSTYTEVNVASNSSQSHTLAGTANSEKIYSEPWGPFPAILIPPGGSINEVEYAQPEKRSNGKVANIEPRDIVHSENYEECQARESEHTAPFLHPPTWEHEEDDSKIQLYSHLNQSEPIPGTQDNVYGMASASACVPISEEENPYEDTSIMN